MCGRYQAWIDDEELSSIIEREKKGNKMKYFRQNEVFPGTEMPIIYGSYSTIRAHNAVWGFPVRLPSAGNVQESIPLADMPKSRTGSRSEIIINARSETAEQKLLFREPFENGRALILASAYYEWSDGVKFRIENDGGEAVLMAALEKTNDGRRYYVILTTEARGTPAKIHDRMPLFVTRSEMRSWFYDESFAREVLHRKRDSYMKITAV